MSAIAIGRRFYLIGAIIAGLASIGAAGRLMPDMTWINRMEDLLLVILRDSPARFLTIAMIEGAAQAMLVFELFWLLRALDVIASALSVFVIEASVKFFEFRLYSSRCSWEYRKVRYALIFGAMGLPLAAGFALAFLRRARSLAIAGVGLAMLALMTRHRRRRLNGTVRRHDVRAAEGTRATAVKTVLIGIVGLCIHLVSQHGSLAVRSSSRSRYRTRTRSSSWQVPRLFGRVAHGGRLFLAGRAATIVLTNDGVRGSWSSTLQRSPLYLNARYCD